MADFWSDFWWVPVIAVLILPGIRLVSKNKDIEP
jgi:hypothetical protein